MMANKGGRSHIIVVLGLLLVVVIGVVLWRRHNAGEEGCTNCRQTRNVDKASPLLQRAIGGSVGVNTSSPGKELIKSTYVPTAKDAIKAGGGI